MKIGHGGTLDPLATGVLIVGIGNGTKSLQQFLDGSKEYECTVLFGAATDSYDILGKVTKTASWEHITKDKVEKALDTLRGPQMQLPPVYSAIRVDGKHLYEYAREGLPIPEIKRRSVTVHELEMVEWLPPEKHNLELPSQEADKEAKLIAERVAWPKSLLSKRKRENGESENESDEPAQKMARSSPPAEAREVQANVEAQQSRVEENAERQVPTTLAASRPSAARLRMKVSSGFYVRSLCHDLGVALDSAGLMATLVRNRQSDFELGKNVIEYEDFEKGDDVWEPQVQKRLEEWQARTPDASEGKGGSMKRHQEMRAKESREEKRPEKSGSRYRGGKYVERRERNSSSPEPARTKRQNSSSPEHKAATSKRRNSSSPD